MKKHSSTEQNVVKMPEFQMVKEESKTIIKEEEISDFEEHMLTDLVRQRSNTDSGCRRPSGGSEIL